MSTTHPTPAIKAEIAALLERCRRTHQDAVAEVFIRAERLARAAVRGVVFRRVTREEFTDLVAIGCMPLPDETQDVFEARRRGLIAGLIAGACDLAAR